MLKKPWLCLNYASTGSRAWRNIRFVLALCLLPPLDSFFFEYALLRDATESGSGNEQQFHGREKNDKIPQLVITYAAPAARSAMEADPNVETWVDSGEQGVELYLPLIQQGGNQAIERQPVEIEPVEIQKGQSEVKAEVVEPVNALYLPLMQSTKTSTPVPVDEERKVE